MSLTRRSQWSQLTSKMVKKTLISASPVPGLQEMTWKPKILTVLKQLNQINLILSSLSGNMQELPAEILLPIFTRDVLEEVGYQVFGARLIFYQLPRKEHKLQTTCKNLRGISLLSLPNKLFCRTYLSASVKELGREQAGFRDMFHRRDLHYN